MLLRRRATRESALFSQGCATTRDCVAVDVVVISASEAASERIDLATATATVDIVAILADITIVFFLCLCPPAFFFFFRVATAATTAAATASTGLCRTRRRRQ